MSSTSQPNETFLVAIWDNPTVPICITDISRQIVRINDAYCEFSGYSRDELLGESIDKLMIEQDIQRAADIHTNFKSQLAANVGECQIIRKDGTKREAMVNLTHIVENEVPFFLAVLTDITPQKEAERHLETSLATSERQRKETERIYQLSRAIAKASTPVALVKVLKTWVVTDLAHELSLCLFDSPVDLAPSVEVSPSPVNQLPTHYYVTASWHKEHGMSSDISSIQKISSAPFVGDCLTQSYVSGNALSDSNLSQSTKDYLLAQGVSALLYIPLIAANRWIGFLTVTAVQVAKVDSERLRWYHIATELAALPLDNWRLINSLEQTVSERTAEIAATQKTYEAVLENYPNGSIVLFDKDFRYTMFKGEESQRLGIEESMFVGKTIYELLDAELIAQLEPIYQATFRGEAAQHDVSFAGQLYSARFVPIYLDGNSEVQAGMMMSQRITEQRKAENALKESEARLRTLISNMPVVLFSTDKDGVYTLFEGRDLASIGRASGDVVGESLFERYSNDTALLTNVRTALAGEAVTFESYTASTRQYFDNIYTPIYDADGELSGMIGLAIDITDRKHTEQALVSNEQRLRMVVANLPVIIFTTDKEGVFTLSEGKALVGLGLAPGQVVGLSLFTLYKDMQGVSEAAKRALEGESIVLETQVAGQVYENYISPLYDESDNINGVLGIAYDITERKHAAQQLEHNNIRLAKLNDLDNELKTVNSIDGILACVADYLGPLGRGAAFGLSYIDLDNQGRPEWATFTATHLDQANIQHSPIGTRTHLDKFPGADIWLANMHEATFFMDIANDTRLDNDTKRFFKSLHRESAIFIPLINQNRWIGVVTVGWEHQQPLMDELVELCASLPTALAPVVEVMRLVGELEQTLAERTQDLQQSQALLDGFFTHAPGAVWVKDLDLRFMRANNASEIFYNKPASEIIGLSDADIFETSRAAEFASPERQVIDTKQVITLEEDIPTRVGTRNLITTKFPIFNEDNEVLAVGGFSTDVTDMRREVKESQNLLRLVIDNMPGIVVWKDRNLNFLGGNKRFADIAGFASPDEIVGKTDFDTTTNREAAAGYRRDDLEVMHSGKAKLNFEEVSPADKSSWLRTSKLPLRNEQGDVIGLLGLAEDIT
ncbi:MAG: PAS domain-containing protein, partial [Deinococcota bacterium]